MAMASLSPEEENYVRMSLLMTGISPRAVRCLFDYEFHPTCLRDSLTKAHIRLIELKQKRIINQAQLDLLYPKSGDDPDSKTFDITLMISLLKYLTEGDLGEFDKLPTRSQTTSASDLARIKHYRNILAHSNGTIGYSFFDCAWTDLTYAIVRLGGQQLGVECDQLKIKPLDRNNRELMNDIQQSNNEIREEVRQAHEEFRKEFEEFKNNHLARIPHHVQEDRDKKVSRWQLEDVNFAETNASRDLLATISQQDIDVVTVIGPDECGKSFLAKHVALKMKEVHGYVIVPVHEFKEIADWYDSSCNQLFVFDDVCTSLSLLDQTLKDWKVRSEGLIARLDGNKLKMIACCPTVIYDDPKFQQINLLVEHKFDLRGVANSLSDEDIISIASRHMEEKDVKIIKEMKDNLKKLDNFPMLCKKFANVKPENTSDFFSCEISKTSNDTNSASVISQIDNMSSTQTMQGNFSIGNINANTVNFYTVNKN